MDILISSKYTSEPGKLSEIKSDITQNEQYNSEKNEKGQYFQLDIDT